MRCKACNTLLSNSDIYYKRDVGDGKIVHEDMCAGCRSKAHEQDSLVSIYWDDGGEDFYNLFFGDRKNVGGSSE